MKIVSCPICRNLQNQEGFRPIQFSCDRCGLNGEWFKEGRSYASRGYIKWASTPSAVQYVMNKIGDDYPGLPGWLLYYVAEEKVDETLQGHQHDLPRG